MNRRFLSISFCIHLFGIIVLALFQGSQIKKTFVAYGRHSRVMTQAYFRRLTAPKFNYNKYYKSRVKPRRKKKKKLVKRKVIPKKKIVKKLAKKKAVKKIVKANKKKLKKIEVVQKKVVEEEILHFNLLGENDPKMIKFQKCIQNEVDRIWSPPLGVPKGTECLVLFVVNNTGNVKSFKIKNKSKILIYDLSIVKIGQLFKFDKCLWGKSFVINFRQ
jgi:hypothetical protein